MLYGILSYLFAFFCFVPEPKRPRHGVAELSSCMHCAFVHIYAKLLRPTLGYTTAVTSLGMMEPTPMAKPVLGATGGSVHASLSCGHIFISIACTLAGCNEGFYLISWRSQPV